MRTVTKRFLCIGPKTADFGQRQILLSRVLFGEKDHIVFPQVRKRTALRQRAGVDQSKVVSRSLRGSARAAALNFNVVFLAVCVLCENIQHEIVIQQIRDSHLSFDVQYLDIIASEHDPEHLFRELRSVVENGGQESVVKKSERFDSPGVIGTDNAVFFCHIFLRGISPSRSMILYHS